MERSKTIISIVVGLAAILIIWRVGISPEVPQPAETTEQIQAVVEPGQPGPAESPADSNEPQVASDSIAPERGFASERQRRGGRTRQASEPGEIGDPNDPLVAISLSNTDMRNIIQRLTEWTGRVIIPSDEALRVRLTIYAPERVTRSKALDLIYSALRIKGFTARHAEEAIYIDPIGDTRLDTVPIISADQALAMIEDKNKIVQKFFTLKNYSPSQMGQVLLPMMGEYGYISANEESGSLLVIDTVRNLMTIALIIQQFDATEKMMEEIFEVRYRNPAEIIELLETLLAESSLTGTDNRQMAARGGRAAMQQQARGRAAQQRGGARNRTGMTSGTATSITVGTGRAQPVLVAETRNNWIIAKATAEDMELIRQWIKTLDTPVDIVWDPAELASLDRNAIVQKFFYLEYGSPQQMAQVIEPLLTENGSLTAEEYTRTLLVIDTAESLMRIEGVINKFDAEGVEQNAQQIFVVKYGDPSEIVQLIRIILGEEAGTTGSRAVLGRTTGRTTTRGR